jgi:hypothetical protein
MSIVYPWSALSLLAVGVYLDNLRIARANQRVETRRSDHRAGSTFSLSATADIWRSVVAVAVALVFLALGAVSIWVPGPAVRGLAIVAGLYLALVLFVADGIVRRLHRARLWRAGVRERAADTARRLARTKKRQGDDAG